MNAVKEYCKSKHNTTFIVRLRSYDKRLSAFLKLYSIARADFSDLQTSECSVVQYAGKRIKGVHGLEFQRDCDPPDGYDEISELEFIK